MKNNVTKHREEQKQAKAVQRVQLKEKMIYKPAPLTFNNPPSAHRNVFTSQWDSGSTESCSQVSAAVAPCWGCDTIVRSPTTRLTPSSASLPVAKGHQVINKNSDRRMLLIIKGKDRVAGNVTNAWTNQWPCCGTKGGISGRLVKAAGKKTFYPCAFRCFFHLEQLNGGTNSSGFFCGGGCKINLRWSVNCDSGNTMWYHKLR